MGVVTSNCVVVFLNTAVEVNGNIFFEFTVVAVFSCFDATIFSE